MDSQAPMDAQVPSDGGADPRDARAHERARKALARARRLVVKIGSKALSRDEGGDDPIPRRTFERLASQIAEARAAVTPTGREREVMLVSSGAIALGVVHLGMTRRPEAMPLLQAAAAAGQGLLMHRYGEAFGKHGLRVAQVLLSHADLANRARANNARAALIKLLELGAVPIINENDAVAVDEIRFGDNDELAAMVTSLCSAELCVLLSDVDGLLDDAGRRVPFVPHVGAVERLATAAVSSVGRGGMRSKLEAARRATLAGANVVIANAREPDVVTRVLAGEDVGTLLPARTKALSTRKHWIAYTLRPRGGAIVDDGAVEAIVGGHKSVLCVGVLGVRGGFVRGELISVLTRDGVEVARGLARMSAPEAARLAGTRENGEGPLVHRDDLVVLPR